MKILFVQESDWLKRGPHQQHFLAELLSLRGHEVHIIDYELLWKKEKKKELRSRRRVVSNVTKIYPEAKVSLFRPGIIKIAILDYISLIISHRNEIHRQIEEFEPDIIVGWSILNSYLAARAAKQTQIPFVYYWIDVLHKLIPFTPFQVLGRLVESRTLKLADKVLTINHKLKEYVEELGAPAERTEVLGAGVDIHRFSHDNADRHIREQYGLAKNDVVLFFMGWLYSFSGLKEVMLQMAKLRDSNLRLLIVGEGDAYADLVTIKRNNNLDDKVILTGKIPYQEIPNYVAAADICLLPAYPWESTMWDIVPIKMYEYMAMRKPVIATNLPGVRREFGEDNGVLYVEQPEDVVTKALELVNSGNIIELGLKSCNFASKNTWDNVANDFEKILKDTIARKRQKVI